MKYSRVPDIFDFPQSLGLETLESHEGKPQRLRAYLLLARTGHDSRTMIFVLMLHFWGDRTENMDAAAPARRAMGKRERLAAEFKREVVWSVTCHHGSHVTIVSSSSSWVSPLFVGCCCFLVFIFRLQLRCSGSRPKKKGLKMNNNKNRKRVSKKFNNPGSKLET